MLSLEELTELAREYLAKRPLYLDAQDLTNKFGFGDGDVLDDWAALVVGQLEGALASDSDDQEDRGIARQVLAHLVHDLIVVPLASQGVSVRVITVATSHNPLRRRSVNGLIEDEVPRYEALVRPEDLVVATLRVLEGSELPEPLSYQREGAHETGLLALKGRSVEVATVGSEDNVVGILVGLGKDFLTLVSRSFDGCVMVVPLSSVRYVATFRLTEEEDELLTSTLYDD